MRFLSIFLALLLPSLALSEPLAPETVSSQAKWLLHVDFDALRDSRLGGQMMTELRGDKEVARRLEGAEAVLRMDPMADVGSLTLFGPDEDERNSVALLRGKMDAEHLVRLLKLGDGYEAKEVDGAVLHSWHDEGKAGSGKKRSRRLFGNVLAADALLIGHRPEVLMQGRKAFLDRSVSLAESNPAGLPLPERDSAIVVVSLQMRGLARVIPNAKMLAGAESMRLEIFEGPEGINVEGAMVAADAKTAEQLTAMANGLLAFARLDDGNPDLKQLIDAAKVSSEGPEIQMDLGVPKKMASEILDKVLTEVKKGLR